MVGKIADFGHKYGKGFGKRAAHPYPIFLGVAPGDKGTVLQRTPYDVNGGSIYLLCIFFANQNKGAGD